MLRYSLARTRFPELVVAERTEHEHLFAADDPFARRRIDQFDDPARAAAAALRSPRCSAMTALR